MLLGVRVKDKLLAIDGISASANKAGLGKSSPFLSPGANWGLSRKCLASRPAARRDAEARTALTSAHAMETTSDVARLILGQEGSIVKLDLKRNVGNDVQYLTFNLARQPIAKFPEPSNLEGYAIPATHTMPATTPAGNGRERPRKLPEGGGSGTGRGVQVSREHVISDPAGERVWGLGFRV